MKKLLFESISDGITIRITISINFVGNLVVYEINYGSQAASQIISGDDREHFLVINKLKKAVLIQKINKNYNAKLQNDTDLLRWFSERFNNCYALSNIQDFLKKMGIEEEKSSWPY